MQKSGAKAYLVNTGWNGTGKRISIKDTRGIIDAILPIQRALRKGRAPFPVVDFSLDGSPAVPAGMPGQPVRRTSVAVCCRTTPLPGQQAARWERGSAPTPETAPSRR